MNIQNPVTLLRLVALFCALSTSISLLGLFYRPLPHVYFLDQAGYPAPPLEQNAEMHARVTATLISRALAEGRTSFLNQGANSVITDWSANVLANGALATLPRITGTQIVTVTHTEVAPDKKSAKVEWYEVTTTLRRTFTANLAITYSEEWRSNLNPLGVVVLRVIDHQIYLSKNESESNQ